MPEPRSPGTSVLDDLWERYFEGHPDRIAQLEEERQNFALASEIYRLRTEARLTQAQLAKRIGTSASVISRLEDADYEGHSLTMLRRVAAALGCRIDVRFVPVSVPAGAMVAEPETGYGPEA